MMAAEMAVIRLTHVADLPDPETLIRRLQSQPQPAAVAAPAAPRPPQGGPRMAGVPHPGPEGPATAQGAVRAVSLAPAAQVQLSTFDQVVALIREKRDLKLLVEVENSLRLVHFAPGRIEFQPAADAPPDLAARLSQYLQAWTGIRWGISVTASGGAATIAETRSRDRLAAEADVARLPLVQAVLAAFPGAKIAGIRTPSAAVPAADEALTGAEDEWDPFEDN
jgi:DNA polymerase-3 subunit gamma/tau